MFYLCLALRGTDTREDGRGQKRKRRQSYTPSQMEIIRVAHIDRGLGYKNIIKAYPEFGLTESGVRGVCERLDNTGATDRKSGSGRKKVVRTETKVEEARDLTLGNLAGGRGVGG